MAQSNRRSIYGLSNNVSIYELSKSLTFIDTHIGQKNIYSL